MSRFGRSARGDADQPDFASVYAGDAVLSPRLAAHLWVAAVYLSDTYGEDPQSEMAVDLQRRRGVPITDPGRHRGDRLAGVEQERRLEVVEVALTSNSLCALGRIRTCDTRFRNWTKRKF